MNHQHSVPAQHALIILAFAVPACLFMAAVIRYSVNIPIYDDITQILWVTNAFVEGKMDPATPPFVSVIEGRVHAIFYPNAGHVPMVTRLFAIAQYVLGGVNFYYATIIACAFWVATVFFVLRNSIKEGLPLYALLPLPFLLFSLAQWEAMAVMLGGIQMYIGTLFLPLLTLYALTKRRVVYASVGFFLALFASGGAMSLLPLGMGYLLWQRNWKGSVIFILLALPSVWLFRHFDAFGPVLMAQHIAELNTEISTAFFANLLAKISYLLVFLGNISTNGELFLRPLITQHLITGIVLVIVGCGGLLFCRRHHFTKLVFIYVVLLAGATTLMRSSTGINTADVVPRYSVFALLATGMAYILITQYWQDKWPRSARLFIVVATLAAALLWGHSLVLGASAFNTFKISRIADMRDYVQSGDASKLMWDPAWCKGILDTSQRLNVYNYADANNLQ